MFGSLTRGGTETLMLDVFLNARKYGLDAISVYRKTGEFEQDFMNSGVPMFKLVPKTNILVYLLRLRKLLLSHQVDIVHAQQPIDALYAYLACKGTKMRIILTLHGYDFNDNQASRSVLKYIISRTDKNIFVSNAQQHYYVSKFKLNHEKQCVVYNGISFSKIIDAFDKQAIDHLLHGEHNIKKELNISDNSLLITSVGNFLPARDQMTLCKFAMELKKLGVNFHLILIGKRVNFSPESYDNCISFCRDNKLSRDVSFPGVRSDVPEILAQSDAFVYATYHDTFGIAVAEAMATGIPVFVNDWKVMQEITADGKYASLYKTEDEKDLLEKFMLFLENKNSFIYKTKLAQQFVRETYSIESHISNLMQQYEF